MWVTKGDAVRQELLPDGRYEEARGATEKAHTGCYRVVGDDIYYVDDTGSAADGQLRDDVLHHDGASGHRWPVGRTTISLTSTSAGWESA